jgi:hypothetical protein
VARLTIIVGMGGSGKTRLCNKLAMEGNTKAFPDATLPAKDGDHLRRAGHDRLGELVARLLGSQEECVMDEAHLVNADFRNRFKDFCDRFLIGVKQEWIFFEHNVVACINNIYHDYENTRTRPDPGRLVSFSIFRLTFSCVCGEGLEPLSCCHYAACAL